MKHLWYKIKREYFDVPINIRNGIIILLIFLLICISIPFIYNNYFQEAIPAITSEEIAALDSAVKLLQHPEKTIDTAILKPFDPNKLEIEKWVEYGIPLWLGKRINNYVQKGGKLKKHEDLLKIYGFTQAKLEKVAPYLVFSPEFLETKKQDGIQPAKVSFIKESKVNSFELLEINTADSISLEKLHGIGPVLASRIIKYRKLLGGFYKKEQLKEVFGMQQETYNKIETKIDIDVSKIENIDLDIVNYGTLVKHPYIGKKRAQLIIKLREIESSINKNSLLENNIFTPEALTLLEPYLK